MISQRRPRGLRNNNPLNIRIGNDWRGEMKHGTDRQFEQFTSMMWGCRAGFIILRRYIQQHGCNTVEKNIRRWAPETENDTKAYINNVCRLSGLKRDELLTFENSQAMISLFKAMVQVENGCSISPTDIQMGYQAATNKQ